MALDRTVVDSWDERDGLVCRERAVRPASAG
jgi:hypothetical protein